MLYKNRNIKKYTCILKLSYKMIRFNCSKIFNVYHMAEAQVFYSLVLPGTVFDAMSVYYLSRLGFHFVWLLHNLDSMFSLSSILFVLTFCSDVSLSVDSSPEDDCKKNLVHCINGIVIQSMLHGSLRDSNIDRTVVLPVPVH